jgi:hypothetical protein
MVLKRVRVWSVARLFGTMYGAVGLLEGCLFVGVVHPEIPFAPPFSDWLFGMGAVVTVPLLCGVSGLIGGALVAWVYNLFARLVGGLDLEVQ